MTDLSTTNSDRELIHLIDEAGIAHSFAAALAFAVESGSIPDEVREPLQTLAWHSADKVRDLKDMAQALLAARA